VDKPKISREKAFVITISICIVALLIGIFGILLMPNIKGLFHKDSNVNPHSYVFTENDNAVSVKAGDDFEIRFKSYGGVEEGEGWGLLSNYSQDTLSLMEGAYESGIQVWKFYGKAKGTTPLSFQKGNTTKEFTVTIN
jgi:hypothetical protein